MGLNEALWTFLDSSVQGNVFTLINMLRTASVYMVLIFGTTAESDTAIDDQQHQLKETP